jgi:hypothetical protein
MRFDEANPKAAPACSGGFHIQRIDDESPRLALLVRTACGWKISGGGGTLAGGARLCLVRRWL